MKLLLNNSENINFLSIDDLSKVIPEGFRGRVLNYGQGEGQVKIDDTVWGFYVNSEGSYYMSFEEGLIDWETIEKLVHVITEALAQQFGVKITVKALGPFTNHPNA